MEAEIIKCTFCQRARPQFHKVPHSTSWRVQVRAHNDKNPEVNGKLLCQYCYETGLNKLDNFFHPANLTVPAETVPPFLARLTAFEERLVARVQPLMHLVGLKYGTLMSKGHVLSLPRPMHAVARHLPSTTAEYVTMRKKGKSGVNNLIHVRRRLVLEAAHGLVLGVVAARATGDSHNPLDYVFGDQGHPDTWCDYEGRPIAAASVADWPVDQARPAHPAYADVTLVYPTMEELPIDGPLPGVAEVEADVEADVAQPSNRDNGVVPSSEDIGPAPMQHDNGSEDRHGGEGPGVDEDMSHSGITDPTGGNSAVRQQILRRLEQLNCTVDSAEPVPMPQPDADATPLPELKTPFFFGMAYPTLFPCAKGDRTAPDFGRWCGREKQKLASWIESLSWHSSGRFARHPTFKFHMHNLSQKEYAFRQANQYIAVNLGEDRRTRDEVMVDVRRGDQSLARGALLYAANIRDTDPYWAMKRKELVAICQHHYRTPDKVNSRLPSFFCSGSLAELHTPSLLRILQLYVTETQGEAAAHGLDEPSKRRRTLNQHGHLIAEWFTARTANYVETVMKGLLGVDKYYWRFEFAKSRGAIHFHGLFWVTRGAEVTAITIKLEEMLQALSAQAQAGHIPHEYAQLLALGQRRAAGANLGKLARQIFGMTASHPEADNDMWPPPEGHGCPPSTDHLKEYFVEQADLDQDYSELINAVLLHVCSSYCLRIEKDKDKDGNPIKSCRMHCGIFDPETKKMTGHELFDVDTIVVEGRRTRLCLRREHPRLVQHIRGLLQGWRANFDSQLIVDTNLEVIVNYIVGYCMKGGHSTSEYLAMFKDMVKEDEVGSTSHRLVRRLMLKTVGVRDCPAQNADFLLAGCKLTRSSEKTEKFSVSMFRKVAGGGELEDSKLDKYVKAMNMLIANKAKTIKQSNPGMTIDEARSMAETETPLKTLYEYASKGGKCIPVFTGGWTYITWPLQRCEEACLFYLMVHGPGWLSTEMILRGHEKASDRLLEWIQEDGGSCPWWLVEMVNEAEAEYKERLPAEGQSQSSPTRPRRNTRVDARVSQDVPTPEDLQVHGSEPRLSGASQILSDLGMSLQGLSPNMMEGADDVILPRPPEGFDHRSFAGNNIVPGVLTEIRRLAEQLGAGDDELMGDTEMADFWQFDPMGANEKQQLVFRVVVDHLRRWCSGEAGVKPLRLLVSGTAGTGKSFVTSLVDWAVRGMIGDNPEACRRAAPTGTAAFGIRGVTLHRIFCLSKNDIGKSTAQKLQDTLPNIVVCQIDERSMVGAEMLAQIDRSLQVGRDCEEPLGDVPVLILYGDDAQLPPIGDVPCWKKIDLISKERPKQISGARLYQQFDAITLTQIMRQDPNETVLRRILEHTRSLKLDEEDLDLLNSRVLDQLPEDEKAEFDAAEAAGRCLHLFTRHIPRLRHNRCRLVSLENVVTVRSVNGCSHGRKDKSASGFQQLPYVTELAVGAKVRLTKNFRGNGVEMGLVNGATGTVVDILYSQQTPDVEEIPTVLVEFDGFKGPDTNIIPDYPRAVPIIPITVACDQCKSQVARKMLPLDLAWGLTVWASQGMTAGPGQSMTHIVLHPGEDSVEKKSPGVLFVMLSRIKTLRALAIDNRISFSRLHCINDSAHNKSRAAEERRLARLESTMDSANLPSFVECVQLVSGCRRDRDTISEM